MNEEPAHASEREPRWTDGVSILHPVFIRFVLPALTWSAAFIVTSITHFCSLGFKRAEAIAPFVVATLAALCVLRSRKYRWGLLRAFLLVAFYMYAIYSPYIEWIHGPGRSHFPPVLEPPDFDSVPVELPEKTK